MTTRLIVAIPGIAIVLAAVALGGPLFTLAVLALVLAAVAELFRLFAAYRPLTWAGYVAAALPVLLAGTLSSSRPILLFALVGAIGVIAIGAVREHEGRHLAVRLGTTALAPLYVGIPLSALVLTRGLEEGTAAVIAVLVGTWAFDSASYFGGKLWGTRPIAPRVSPNKTVEGFITGLVVAVLAVWVAALYMDWLQHLEALALGGAIGLAAYLGDLFESRIKRSLEVKDSGDLLPGHGGILDRFDALIFSAPVGYLVLVTWIL